MMEQHPVENSTAPRLQVYLGHFEDNRGMKNIIGEIYKKLDIPDLTWLSDSDVGEFLKTALTVELQNVGINAVPEKENAAEDGYRVNGSVNLFYGWGTSVSSDFTAAVNFKVSLSLKSRVVMARSYYSEKKGAKKQSDCRPLLISATTEAMERAAGDIREFLLQEAEREKEQRTPERGSPRGIGFPAFCVLYQLQD